MKRKRHSAPEVAAKLRQADEMAAAGRLQGEIARALGVSVMTYHRWRTGRLPSEAPRAIERREQKPKDHAVEAEQASHLEELQLENRRLRKLVTDLLLEKVKLEELL